MLPPLSSANSEKQINNPDKSLSEPSRIQSMAFQTTASLQGTLGQRPFRAEMVAKEWLTYQMDTFQVTKKPGKKNIDFLQASKVRGFKIHGGN